MLELSDQNIEKIEPLTLEIIEKLDGVPELDKIILLSYLAKQVSYEAMDTVTISIGDEERQFETITYKWGQLSGK
jgi:hypothetical protein